MLRTVKDACILQENALDIRVSDQIEQLEDLINEEGNGREFFDKTYITRGMETLFVEGIARLAGRSNQAIFHLKQAMGGGKTHVLIGFGLLAKQIELRKAYCSHIPYWDIFQETGIASFNGRNTPQTFFWGEIADQLGKAELFRDFWVAGPKAPDEKDWLRLFEGDQPILILLDEMPSYFHYLDTQRVGNGTVADIATRAFANLLIAASKKSNVCIVVSDLAASYDMGTRLINRALEDARQELGRQERNITPVDLEGNEIYDILRRRLFTNIDNTTISEIAVRYGQLLEEATRAKVASRGAEAIADEIVNTYPFHPRLKNLIALFKENEKFKQTRGLLELMSRLLKSVWERPFNDVFLIGPQHFDLSIPEVREKLAEISEMRDVIAKDIWDSNISAHAQIIDSQLAGSACQEVATTIFTVSLSTAVNAIKGLTKEELVEYLISPLHTPTDFLSSFELLENTAWYLHHTPEGRYYFDRQENLTKLLQSLAEGAPENLVDELIKKRLNDMFKATRDAAYEEVLPLPKLDEVADRVRKKRILLIVDPDSKMPPEEVLRFFESLTQKNNVCVLTGDRTEMASVEKAARQVFAGGKAEVRINLEHPQRKDLEEKIKQYDYDLTSVMLNLFDKLLFPIQRPGRQAELASRTLEISRDGNKPFAGEEQIEKTLMKNPIKLYMDIEENFDALREKAEIILWPENQNEVRWKDIIDRAGEKPSMPWLPPNGLEQLKVIACNRGIWEDLGNGLITRKPLKKKTSAQTVIESFMDDNGFVRLRVNPLHAGPTPRIYYAEDSAVSETSEILTDTVLRTNALRVNFLVVDPTGQFETGDPVQFKTDLIIRSELLEKGSERKVALYVTPRGNLKYTLNNTEPRDGIPYTGPIDIGDEKVTILVFAECEGLEKHAEFQFPEKNQTEVSIKDQLPTTLTNIRLPKKMDSRAKVFLGLSEAKQRNIKFEHVSLTVGQGIQLVQLTIGEVEVKGQYIEMLLNNLLEVFDEDAPVVMTFKKAHFTTGHDLKQFIEQLGIIIEQSEVIQ